MRFVNWTARVACLFLLFFLPVAVAFAQEKPGPYPLYLKVRLDQGVKVSALKPGDVLKGTLSRSTYAGADQVFPAGSAVRLVVDKLEKRPRPRSDRWPWVVRVFLPRRQNSPLFQSAQVSLPDGAIVPLQVALISIGDRQQVRAEAKSRQRQKEEMVLTVQAALSKELKASSGEMSAPAPVTLEAGTQARIILLGDVSASGSHAGDVVQARLTEPVRVGSQIVLPEGSIFQGEVVRSKQPRWLSRSGSLLLRFNNLTLPGGVASPLTASVSAAELDGNSQTRLDAEGQLKGGSPGKAWMAANLGVSAAIAKATDDGLQLAIEALASTATDVSTAGAARIVALCASGVFMATRHGRDVVLPKYTEMEITFDRAVLLPPSQAVTSSDVEPVLKAAD